MMMSTHTAVHQRSCRKCGCTETDPCILDDGSPCAWSESEPELCTACEHLEQIIHAREQRERREIDTRAARGGRHRGRWALSS